MSAPEIRQKVIRVLEEEARNLGPGEWRALLEALDSDIKARIECLNEEEDSED